MAKGLSYKGMAAVLAQKLTDWEFAQLIDVLDRDANGRLLKEANAINYIKHPEVYGKICECGHPEMEHSGVPSDRFCYCNPCECREFKVREG